MQRNKVAAAIIASLILGTALFGLGALRYAADIKLREQATLQARALAEASLAQANKNLKVAEANRAVSLLEEGNALGAAGQWQLAARRFEAADTVFKGLGEDDVGPNAGMADVLLSAPSPVWVEPHFHAERITEVLLNHDESLGYSSSLDGTVKVFDPRTRQVVHTFDVGVSVWSLALDSRDSRLAAALDDGSVIVWDLSTHTEVARLFEESSRVRAVAFSHDDQMLTAGYYCGTVVSWRLPDRARLARWSESPSEVRSLAFTSQGTLVVGLTHELPGPWARLRDPRSGRLIQSFTGAGLMSGARNVAVDTSTNTFYAGTAGGIVVQRPGAKANFLLAMRSDAQVTLNQHEGLLGLGLRTGEMEVRSLKQPANLVFALRQDGGDAMRIGGNGRVFSGNHEGSLSLWSIHSQPMMGNVTYQPGAIGVRLVMGAQVVLVERANGRFSAFDRNSGKQLWSLQFPVPPRSFSAPSASGTLLATGDELANVRVFELPHKRERFSIKLDRPVRFMRFSPDLRWLGATSSKQFQLWDAMTGQAMTQFDMGEAHRLVTFSADGKQVAAARDSNIVVVDTGTWSVVKSIPFKAGWSATDGFWDPVSGELVVAFHGQGVMSYDLRTGRERVLAISEHVQNQVARAGSAKALLFGSGNQQDGQVGVAVWDVTKKRRAHMFNSGPTSVVEPTLVEGMDLAASVTTEGHVVIWDLAFPSRYRRIVDGYETAVKAQGSSTQSRLALARYFALRGLHDWAAQQFIKVAQDGGALRAEVSALEYGRALWLAGHLKEALVQYHLALASPGADQPYLHQCIEVIEAELTAGVPLGGAAPVLSRPGRDHRVAAGAHL